MMNLPNDEKSRSASQLAPQAVQRYYERNTNLFLSHGRQSRTRTIHRAVWAPGVIDLEAALNATHEMIRQELESLRQPETSTMTARLQVIDLGCGVGGSLFYLAERIAAPFWGIGLTISPHQARLANSHARELTLQGKCGFIEADFLHVPLAPRFDAIFSIEAFAHSSDPHAYLREAARLLRPGGRLLLCDDFRQANGDKELTRSVHLWLAAFQRGWHVPHLSTYEQVIEMAQPNGFCLVSQIDLTPTLRLSKLPVPLARLLVVGWMRTRSYHPYIGSLLGGLALQQCLKQGLISYRFLVLQKSG